MYGWYAWKRNWTWQRRRSKTKLGQEGENVKEILVVGGGAAGIAAALSAAEAGGRVTILEGLNRPGKKLLVTGNGRCNLGNTRIAPECYHTARPDRLKVLLKQMPTTLTTDFFERWGLMTMADEAAQMELNAMEPVMAQCCFESAELLINGFDTLRIRCVDGITANEEKCLQYVRNSIGVVTALNPIIGYKNSTKIAKEALETGRGVYELVLEHGILNRDELDEVLRPENMIHPVKLDIKPRR